MLIDSNVAKTNADVISALSAPKARLRLKGNLEFSPNFAVVEGWLAAIGDPSPRMAIVRCGDVKLQAVASFFRGDLQDKINGGRHAFSINLPEALLDGNSHEFVLIDAATGRIVCRRSGTWEPQALTTTPLRLKGNLEFNQKIPVIEGWLAGIGEPKPREAIIRSDNVELRTTASAMRRDLKERGVNEGQHAFAIDVPEALLDGNAHEFILIDAATDRIVCRRSGTWKPQAPAVSSVDLRAVSVPKVPLKLQGYLEFRASSIRGWLAAIGELSPREAIIRSGGVEMRVVASAMRKDLKEHGINRGEHGFAIDVPEALLDGNPHELILIDAATGQIVCRRSGTWQPQALNKAPLRLKGNLEFNPKTTSITGWLAAIGDPSAREVIIRSGNIEMRTIASTPRKDLKDHGVNEGRHSFLINIPLKMLNGKPHEVELIDSASGEVVCRRSGTWHRVPRNYKSFDDFLRSSMTQPIVNAPFEEEDKRCFAVMENIADRLCNAGLNISEPPLISIIMPIYNRETIVGDAIRSVLTQRYPHFELIAVDDGSVDASVKAVRAFEDPRIHHIIMPQNVGHSQARNAGLAAARGEIIAYLDSDNQWDDRYLGMLAGAFAELPQADAIASGQLLYRGFDSEAYAVRYGHLNKALLENRNYIDLNAFSHRRNVLDVVKGFNTNLRRYVDYDLILRIMDIGNILTIPVLLSHYYYDKAENTVTSGVPYPEDMESVRNLMEVRQKNRIALLDLEDLVRPVAVVIPSWQALDDIKECIAALRARDWHGMLEIIVVDNASDRNVLRWLRKMASAGKIHLIANSDNLGFSAAVNQGIEAASSDTDILILNNDAIMQPGSIQTLQKAAYILPEAGITVPRQILPTGTKTQAVHGPYVNVNYPSDANLSAHHQNIEKIGLFHDGGAVELNYAPFFATYVKREIIAEIGVLDAEFGRHYRSDRMYCDFMRAVTGKKIYYVPESHAIHKLQKATDILRQTNSGSASFDLMFRRNQWSEEDLQRFGYRKASWDIF